MALLEYLNRTVPDLVKNRIPSFFAEDPLLNALAKNNRVDRSGGSYVKLYRTKSGHSDFTRIDSSNITVPLVKKDTFSDLKGDWGKLIKPIIIPNVDIDRAPTPAEKKKLTQDVTEAAMQSGKNQLCRQLYMGDESILDVVGTLNGVKTGLRSVGLENGALFFDTPTNQAAAGVTYLNETRVYDSVNDENNWYNQHVRNTAIGTDFIDTAEEIKAIADTYAEEGEISLGIVSIADLVKIGKEARSYPGGAGRAAIVYTPEDIEKGRIHKTVEVINGVHYHANRWMTPARLRTVANPLNNAAFLLNPKGIQLWVNGGHYFKTRKFHDGLETSNHDALISFISLEVQFAVINLLAQGCTSSN
jgi:hypothetical protein|tara:strand:- start:2961 stop:4040 length:1080 start_codon:yes stop_codon:yes gene_type:complete